MPLSLSRPVPSFRQLRYFVEVARTGSLRQAGARLGVSQPTLTAQIAALEERLGHRLFERSRGGMIVTPFARDLIGQVDTILHEMTLLIEMAKAGAGGPAGTHRLGVTPSIGPYLLPEVISALHDSYPELRLHVREDAPRDLEAKLLEGHHDLIIVPLPLSLSELSVEILYHEPLHLIAACDHPLASKDLVDDADLEGQKLLALDDRYRYFDQVQELAQRFGARLMREYEGTSLDTLRHMVGMNMGLGFLPALYVRSEIAPRRDVSVLRMRKPPAQRTVALAWRPRSPHRRLYREIATLFRRICQTRLKDVIVIEPAGES